METILKKYDDSAVLLELFGKKLESLLTDLTKNKAVNFHQIISRLKSRESLSKKLLTKQGYTCLEDVTDVIGCRIITYFEDEVDKIADVIEKEFEIDRDNSIDKRKTEFDRFGYLSLHYVAKLGSKRTKLTEYKKFKDIKFEIQIRSILQHSWAEIEHDIGYKGKFSIPNIVKRRFSRIAALLETADLEFVRLRDELSVYEKNVPKEIKINPSSVSVDRASLISFMSTNKNLKRADEIIAENLNIDLKEDNSHIEERISVLEFAGLKSIYDLEQLYQNYFNCIIQFSKNWRKETIHEKRGSGLTGISIYDALFYHIAKTKTKEEFKEHFELKYKGTRRNIDKELLRCYSSFELLEKICR